VVLDGALDVSATFVGDVVEPYCTVGKVIDKGGVKVQGAVKDHVHVKVNLNVYGRLNSRADCS